MFHSYVSYVKKRSRLHPTYCTSLNSPMICRISSDVPLGFPGGLSGRKLKTSAWPPFLKCMGYAGIRWCRCDIFRRVLFFPVLKLTFVCSFSLSFRISESFTNLFKSSGHLGCFPEASEASHHQIDVVNVSIDPSRPLIHQDQPGEGGQREGQRGLALKSRWNGEMLDEKLRNDNFGLTIWQQCDNFFFWRKQCDNLMWQHISEKINIKKETVYTAFVLTVWICYHQQQDGVPVFQQNHTSLPGRVNINLSGRLTASAIPKMFWLGRCSTIMPNNYNTNYNH